MIKFCDKKRYAAVKYVYYYTSRTRILCQVTWEENVLRSFPLLHWPPVTLIEEGIAKMTLEETREMRDFATYLGRSVRHHSVRDESKEDTGHLPYAITFSFQEREPSSKIETTALMEGQNDAQQQERELPSLLQCEVYFKSKEVIAVKHNRRREQWGFFLALLLKDLLVKERRGNELVFTDNVMHILWLDNSDTGDKFIFSEAYRDDRNSPYTIIDRVRTYEIITDASGWDLTSSLKRKRMELNDCWKVAIIVTSTLTKNSSKMKKCPMRIRLMNLPNVCLSALGRGVHQHAYSCFDL